MQDVDHTAFKQRAVVINISKMRIDCYFSKACSAKDALRNNILESMKREGVDASAHFHSLDEKEAQALGLTGSPSICIDGADILPGEISGFA